MQSSLVSDASFYKQLFERTHTINLIIDFETGQIVEANPAACRFYGYSYEELIGKRLADINVMPESGIRAVMQGVMSGERTTFQTQHHLANGMIVDVEVFASSIERDGKTYLYAIVTDITAQKRSEKALRESEAIYRLFAQNMPDSSVSMFDTHMRHTLTEGPFLKTFGPIYKELLGKTPQEALPKALADSIMPVYQRALNGESFNYERITDTYAYEAFVTPVRDEDGTIIGGMILSHDITKRIHLEEQLRMITDNMQDMITQSDAQERIIYTSPSSHLLLGYEPEAVTGHSRHDFAHPDDWGKMLAARQELIQQGKTHGVMEGRLRHADGHYVDVETVARFLYDTESNYIGGIFVSRNITKRKRLERELRTNSEQLQIITDNMQDMITRTDVENRIIYTSPSSRILLGYEPDEVTGHFSQEFAHPEDLNIITSVRQKLIQQGLKHGIVEGSMRHADGHYVPVETVARFMYDDASNYMGGVYVTRDITERKRLEEALRASETQLRIITDHMQELVTLNDNKGQITYVNASAQTMLGYSPDLLFGMASGDLIHPDDRALLGEVFREAVVNRTPQIRFESHLRHADGHYIPVETNGRFITDDQLNPISSVFVTRDISERKSLQEALLRQHTMQTELNKELELSNLKSRMMERIAHEFRTPLTIIQVYTETLTSYYERLTPEKRQAKIVGIKDQIRHITDMLDEIGLVVKGNFIPEHLDRVSTDLSSLCREIEAELSTYFNLPHIFTLDVPERMMVVIDPTVLGNALLHIMRNAVRFSDPSTSVTVQLSRVDNGVTLTVIDQGIGIHPDELPRIFDPFFRGTNINERSGLGVGLAIARAGVEAHGGKIAVDSVVGQGTKVKIWLPA